MKKRERKQECSGGAPGWMTSFADLQQLLLVFFVLLFSMSTISLQKFSEVAMALQGSLGVMDASELSEIVDMEYLKNLSEYSSKDYKREDLYMQLKEAIESSENADELKEAIELIRFEDGVMMRIKDSVFFNSGEANIKEEALYILEKVGEILKDVSKSIVVEGHTDNVPIHSTQYPSNWELSAYRAASVVRFLLDTNDISEYCIVASGFGEYHPIVPNTSEDNKSRNRRVDIKVMIDDLDVYDEREASIFAPQPE